MIDTRNFSPPTGGPAFPTQRIQVNNDGVVTGFGVMNDGMTMRDYFAAKAMQSLLISSTRSWPVGVDASVSIAAYQVADAMLEARK